MILLPILSIIGLYVLIYCQGQGNNRRMEALIYSILGNAVYCFAITEILSVFHALTKVSLCMCWLLIIVSIIGCFIFALKKQLFNTSHIKKAFSIVGKIKISFALFNYLILLVVGIYSIMTVPYSWDSMSYHLTRIIHWMLNRSVAHYACFDYSQITDPNLGEFIGLQVYLLANGCDRLLNLVQFFSYAISAILVKDICKKIGGNNRSGNVTMLIFLTTPIIMAESMTTQVDLVSALFMVIFVWLGLDFIVKEKLVIKRNTVIKLCFMGFAAGLTYNAKAHSCIAIMIFAVWIVINCIKNKDKAVDIIKATVLVVIPAVIIVLPEMFRNLCTFGSLTADEITSNFLINSLDPRYYVVNCVENFAFNMNNRIWFSTDLFLKITYKLRYLLLGEPYPALLNEFDFSVEPQAYYPDYALNPLITWLVVITIIMAFFRAIAGMFHKKSKMNFSKKDGYIVCSYFDDFFLCYC